MDKLQGQVKIQVKKWIDGSCTVKKNNAVDHLKSNTHNKPIQRLKEKQTPTTGQEIAQSSSMQKTIVEHARDLSKSHKSQLVRKFQLAHFLIVNNKSFNFHKDLVHFTKEFYNRDIGSGYFQNVSVKEMVLHLSKSIMEENITIPLNEGKRL